MIPFYIYYSMFGFQRIGDLAWAAGNSRARGFLLGATAGPHGCTPSWRTSTYYLTLMNENYPHPPMPEGAEEGIRKGMYLFREGQARRRADRGCNCWAAARSCGR